MKHKTGAIYYILVESRSAILDHVLKVRLGLSRSAFQFAEAINAFDYPAASFVIGQLRAQPQKNYALTHASST